MTLRELITSSGPIDEARALKYIRQIAAQAAELHNARSFHGNITPEAVVIDPATDEATLEMPEKTVAEDEEKPYIPEDANISPATDIYSIAAILYEMLTGEAPLPYKERTEGAQMRQLPSTVSAPTAQAVERGLKLNPALRPKSVDVFTQLTPPQPKPKLSTPAPTSIQPVRTGTSEAHSAEKPHLIEGETEVTDNDKREVMQRSLIIGGIAAAAILVAGGSALFCTRQTDDITEDSTKMILLDTILPFDTARIDTTTIEEVNDTMMVEKMEIKNENGLSFTYTGKVVKGLPEGEGHGEYEYGTYDGEYVAGVRQGKAKYITADKENRFEGTFKDDFYDEGILTVSDSTYFKGTFKDGDPWNGNWYNRDKKPFATYRNGKPTD